MDIYIYIHIYMMNICVAYHSVNRYDMSVMLWIQYSRKEMDVLLFYMTHNVCMWCIFNSERLIHKCQSCSLLRDNISVSYAVCCVTMFAYMLAREFVCKLATNICLLYVWYSLLCHTRNIDLQSDVVCYVARTMYSIFIYYIYFKKKME